jgi:hypothetical protein
MIKPGFILALLAILVVVGLSYFLIQSDRPDIKAPEKVGDRILKDAKLDNVTAIELKKDNIAIKIEKKEKNWLITSQKNRPAKADRIEQLIGDAGGAKIESTRDGNPETFKLDDKERTELILTSNGTPYTLYLGKSPDYSKSFVSLDKGGVIYEVDRGLEMSAGVRTEKEARLLDPSYFYDLKVLTANADDIIDVAVKKGHDLVRVQRVIPGKGPVEPKQEIPKDTKLEWWITEPEGVAAEETAVTRITNSFISMNMKKYADGISDKDSGLDHPAAKIRIRLKDGTEHTMTFGKVEREDVYAAIDGRDDRFVIFKFTYDNVALTLNDLKKKEPGKDASVNEPRPNPQPNPADSLTPEEKERIRQATEAQMNNKPVKPKDNIPTPPPLEPKKETKEPPAVIKSGPEKKLDEKK